MEERTFTHTQQYLLHYGIKPSVQRTAIMDYLLTHRTHPTVDDIYTALSPHMPRLSRTTVYNTLHLFARMGAVHVLTFDERYARYDVDVSEHAHFRCRVCEQVYDLREGLPKSAFGQPRIEGFDIDTVDLSYTGVCPRCKHADGGQAALS